jgi:hypothetical protein
METWNEQTGRFEPIPADEQAAIDEVVSLKRDLGGRSVQWFNTAILMEVAAQARAVPGLVNIGDRRLARAYRALVSCAG